MNKIYLIKWQHYDYTFVESGVHSAYINLPSAQKALGELDAKNSERLQKDSYGPIKGLEYVIEEVELRGLTCV